MNTSGLGENRRTNATKTGQGNDENKIRVNEINKIKRTELSNKQLRVATWNIKTLLRTGKMEETAREIENYNIDITAVQEIRWEGAGEITKDKYTFLYSGEKKRGHNGVGFYVKRNLVNNILEFRPVNGRIALLRLKIKESNISIVNIYAPTEGSEQNEKEQFYETLNKTCEKVPKKDEVILMGDANAQVGKEQYLQEVIGSGKGTIHDVTNDNGHRLCQLAEALNMTLLSTKFEHPRQHKATWRHPAGNIENQIDHILATKKIGLKVKDTRSYRGAQAETDHYLVIATIKDIELTKKYYSRTSRKKWETDALKNKETLKRYQEKYISNIQGQTDNTKDIEKQWKQLQNNIIKTAQQVLTKKTSKNTNKDWYDEECEDARKQKNMARMRWIDKREEQYRRDYERQRNIANITYKRKKNEWLSKKLEKIDQEGRETNIRQFYKEIKQQTTTPKSKPRGIKDKNGRIQNDPEIIGKIWQEYYENILYEDGKTITNENLEMTEEEEDEAKCPTEIEVKEQIKRLRNGKAPGEDGIEAELLKYGGEQMQKQIHQLIQTIWTQNKIPEEWNTGIITPIHKKGDKENCKNYRAITLLNITYKILANLINIKLKSYAENVLGDYQNGFRPGRSTINAIHTIDQMVQKTWEHNGELHIIFIDFRSAFDSINRQKMIEGLETLKVPRKLKILIEAILQNTKAKIRYLGTLTEEIKINKGVKQGDSISPTLFNMVLENVMRKAKLNNKNIITNEIQAVAYADDVTILAKTREQLINAVNKLETEAGKVGLEINQEKTKYMRIARQDERGIDHLRTQKHIFETVSSLNYLGVTIGHTSKERIRERLQKGYRTFGRNKKLLRSKNISKKNKIKIYKTLIRPVIAYAMETTVINKKEEDDLKIIERKIMRTILGPNTTEDGERRLKKNKEIEEELGGENIVRYIKAQRLNWAGHIMRRKPAEMVRRITQWIPLWSRGRGRPRNTWRNQIEEDVKILEIVDWKAKCRNRKEWRKLTNEARTNKKL